MGSFTKRKSAQKKLRSNKTVPKRKAKQSESVETKVINDEIKSPLKTTLTKVRISDISDGPVIYKVKETTNVPIDSEEQARTGNQDTFDQPNATSICTQIPTFTDTDIVSE